MQKELKLKSDQEELLIVVDENDNILNYLPRGEVHKSKLLHRTIGVVVFNGKGELILQRRSVNKDTYPGKLGNAAGGHVTKGQDYLEAAKQEAFEEIGLDQPLDFVKKVIVNDPVHRTMTSVYQTVSDGPFKQNNEEIDEIIIIPLIQLKRVASQFYPGTRIILKAVGVLK